MPDDGVIEEELPKPFAFDGGRGGEYEVEVQRRPLTVRITLEPDATWKDYADAVQERLNACDVGGVLGENRWLIRHRRLDV